MVKGTEGIWAPWGKLLCGACHGNKFREDVLSADYMQEHYGTERTPGEREALTTCNTCGRSIVTDYSLCMENELAKAALAAGVKEARMSQTGGMCSAASAELPNGFEVQAVWGVADTDWVVGANDAYGNVLQDFDLLTDDGAEALAHFLKLCEELRKRPHMFPWYEDSNTCYEQNKPTKCYKADGVILSTEAFLLPGAADMVWDVMIMQDKRLVTFSQGHGSCKAAQEWAERYYLANFTEER